jgi:hypothetical protein
VNVLAFYPVTIYSFIFPGTAELCFSVLFHGGCNNILSLLFVDVLLSICCEDERWSMSD